MTMLRGRHVPLAGPVNFRDLGGYAADGGRHVRWGVLYRSDSLARVTDADARTLRDLGLRTVVDLRSPEEVERAGFHPALQPFASHHHHPMTGHAGEDDTPAGVIARFESSGRDVAEFYLDMLAQPAAQDSVREVFRRLANADSYGLVFHCEGGKDRTGLIAALLLSVLGVGRPDIVADYALTEGYLRPRLDELTANARERYGDLPAELFSAAPETMTRTLAGLDARFGGPVAFLTDCGVPPAAVDALRAHLLDEG